MICYVHNDARTWDATADDPAAVKAARLGPLEVVRGLLDPALFDGGDIHGGHIPSGTVLGLVADTGRFGPYLATATDGRETAAGLLHSSVLVRSPQDGSLKEAASCFIITSGALVRTATLPCKASTHPSGGHLDEAAEQALAGIAFRHAAAPGARAALPIDDSPQPVFTGPWLATRRIG